MREVKVDLRDFYSRVEVADFYRRLNAIRCLRSMNMSDVAGGMDVSGEILREELEQAPAVRVWFLDRLSAFLGVERGYWLEEEEVQPQGPPG